MESRLKVTETEAKVSNGGLSPHDNNVRPKDSLKPHENIQMERLRKSMKSQRGNHFFEDGKRRVDYVLVFMKGNQIKTNDESLAAKARAVFEVNVIQIVN